MQRILASCLFVGMLTAVASAQDTPAALPAGKPLALETIGDAPLKAWYRLLTPGRANDQSSWHQLIWFKRKDRVAPESFFAVANHGAGEITELPAMIPSMEPWSTLWVEGKLYIGMNMYSRLAVYDPAAGTLTDLGEPWPREKGSLTLYSMSVAPDGVLGLGGGTGTHLATYDPKTGQFRNYGRIGGAGADAGYVYTQTMDNKYIYGAVRGTGDWELVRIDRASGERKVLATAPVTKHMSVGGNSASVPQPGDAATIKYWIVDGALVEQKEGVAAPNVTRPGTGFTGSVKPVAIDYRPILKGEPRVEVHFPPAGDAAPRKGQINLVLDRGDIGEVVALPDGRVAGLGRAYYPMVVTNPDTNESIQIPMNTSSYTMAAVGSRVFSVGYPSTNLIMWDSSLPMTLTESVPGMDAVKWDDPKGNPRLVRYFSNDTGGAHIGVCLTDPAADGNCWLAARRHRYFYGFTLAWFDPQTLESGAMDNNAFNHYQVGWVALFDQGRKIAVPTYVEYNKQVPGAAAGVAALFIVDVATKAVIAKHEPLPGVKKLFGAVEVAPNVLVGTGLREDGSTILYRIHAETGKVEQTRLIQGLVLGDAGTLGVPVRTYAFELGPDKKIWTGAQAAGGSLLFKINPADLSIEPIGIVPGGNIRYAFDKGRIYISGAEQVRRIKEVTYDPPMN